MLRKHRGRADGTIAVTLLAIALALALPVAPAADTRGLLGTPFQALQGQIEVVGQELSGVQSAITELVTEVAAAALQTPPEKILILWNQPCPPGYHEDFSYLPPLAGIKQCLLGPPPGFPPPPPLPQVCQEGYDLQVTFPDGSPVPADMVVCRHDADSVATLSVTQRVAANGTTIEAPCPEAFLVIGGGYSASDNDVLVYNNLPLPPDRWRVSGKKAMGDIRTLSAYAICMPVSN